jgi:PAS domain S-box-containing protein
VPKKPNVSKKAAALRKQAGKRLRVTGRDVAAMPVKDVQRLVHELQVHQIEKDMQNEELRRAHVELEAARDRYLDLYDFSPIGHLTLDRQGAITEANLHAGTLLGVNRKELIGQLLAHFVSPDDQNILHRHCQEVLQTGTRKSCGMRLRKETGATQWIHFRSLVAHMEKGRATHWRTALLDITERKRLELALRLHEAGLEAAQSLAHLGSWDWNIQTGDEHWSAEQYRIFGYEPNSTKPTYGLFKQALHPEDRERILTAVKTALNDSSLYNEECRILRPSGEVRFIHCRGEVVRNAQSQPVSMHGTVLDITERKQLGQELEVQRVRYVGIIESAMDAIITVDEGERVVVFNQAAESMFLCQGADAIGQPLDRFIPKRFRQAHHGHMSRFAESNTTARSMGRLGSVYGLRANGDEFPIEASISHIQFEGVSLLTVILRDITALKVSEAMLIQKQQELESLSSKLIAAQEQERRMIARELHDDFNQRLAALSVDLEMMERNFIASQQPVAQQLATVRGKVVQLSSDLHDLAYGLHPSLLDHVGLEVAMRDHVAEFTKRTGLPVTFTAREVPAAISHEVTTNLFRVMQECLQNVFKHAKATDVTVKLSGSSKGLVVSVRDNGKGFNLENTDLRKSGLGLVSMQERARLMGGFLRIHSLPRDGTKVCAWVPRAQEQA